MNEFIKHYIKITPGKIYNDLYLNVKFYTLIIVLKKVSASVVISVDIHLNYTQWELGGFWRDVKQRGYRSVCMGFFYLLSLHAVTQNTTKHLFGNQQLYFPALCVGVGFFNSGPSSALSVFSPGSCFPWGHQRERRHAGHNTKQTWRNPTEMSRDVRLGQVRASLYPVFHRSGELWIHMERVGVFCCLEWLMCLSFFFLFFFWCLDIFG